MKVCYKLGSHFPRFPLSLHFLPSTGNFCDSIAKYTQIYTTTKSLSLLYRSTRMLLLHLSNIIYVLSNKCFLVYYKICKK